MMTDSWKVFWQKTLGCQPCDEHGGRYCPIHGEEATSDSANPTIQEGGALMARTFTVDPVTLLFSNLSDDVATEMRHFLDDAVVTGKLPPNDDSLPDWMGAWLDAVDTVNGPDRGRAGLSSRDYSYMIMSSAVLPQKVGLSLVRHQSAELDDLRSIIANEFGEDY